MFLLLCTYIATIIIVVNARPPNDIKYVHNISLTYDGKQLHNLDSIKQLPGVDSKMASALQEAIKDALPSYLNEIARTTHYGSTTASIPFEKQEVTESTTGTMNITQNIPSIYPQTNISANKQSATISQRKTTEETKRTPPTVQSINNDILRNTSNGFTLNIPTSHLLPNYDDNFWNHDDLVHFYVNIDMVDAAVSDLPAFPVENHSTMDNKN